MLASSVILVGLALVLNNIQRQYPIFWWTPENVGRPKPPPDEEKAGHAADKMPAVQVPETLPEPELVALQRSTSGLKGVLLPEDLVLNEEEERALAILRRSLARWTENAGLPDHLGPHDRAAASRRELRWSAQSAVQQTICVGSQKEFENEFESDKRRSDSK